MNNELTISEAYSLWESKTTGSSVTTHKNKLKEIVEKYGQSDVRKILTEEKLREFIFVNDNQSAEHRRNALVSFCLYVYKELLHDENYVFPISISTNSVKKFDSNKTIDTKRATYDVNYFPPEFDLGELLNDKYYSHIGEPTAIVTLKAIISIYLSIPIGKELLLKGKTSNSYIRLSDVSCLDSQKVAVQLRDCHSFAKEVHISSELAKNIIKYYNLRINDKADTDEFFIKMWHGKFNYDKKVVTQLPGDLHRFILYILKYICMYNGFANVTIDSLRNNVIVSWLIKSKGTALNEIVTICGYQPFVINSYKEYKSLCADNCCLVDFFNIASSDEGNNVDDEATTTYILNRRKRDSNLAKDLKLKYNYICQVCKSRIEIGNSLYYSEAHHIQPFGGEHHGPDNPSNLINLCPNCHAMFDMGVIAIDPTDEETVLHIDKNNSLNGKKIIKKHEFGNVYLRYHYKNIFLKTKKIAGF